MKSNLPIFKGLSCKKASNTQVIWILKDGIRFRQRIPFHKFDDSQVIYNAACVSHETGRNLSMNPDSRPTRESIYWCLNLDRSSIPRDSVQMGLQWITLCEVPEILWDSIGRHSHAVISCLLLYSINLLHVF